MGFLYIQIRLRGRHAAGRASSTPSPAPTSPSSAPALLFAALMAFRTLGGQYSAKDREGVVAAAVFWWATAVVYAVDLVRGLRHQVRRA